MRHFIFVNISAHPSSALIVSLSIVVTGPSFLFFTVSPGRSRMLHTVSGKLRKRAASA